MLLTKLGIYIDKKILNLYIKTNNKLLKKYLEARAKYHSKCIVRFAKDISENGSDESKQEVIKILKDWMGGNNNEK